MGLYYRSGDDGWIRRLSLVDGEMRGWWDLQMLHSLANLQYFSR
jgi:hypothetical protein